MQLVFEREAALCGLFFCLPYVQLSLIASKGAKMVYLHNFKVLFGFRKFGSNVDGDVEGGPFWDVLTAFADDGTFFKVDEASGLVCGPISGAVQGEGLLEAAQKKINTADEAAEWYFTIAETRVSKAPDDKGPRSTP